MAGGSWAVPSYEEVVAFAKEHRYMDIINVTKFYNYYERCGFLYKGEPIDWKAQMTKWAETEKPKRQSQYGMPRCDKEYWTAEELKELLHKIKVETAKWGKK